MLSFLRPFLQASNSFSCISFISCLFCILIFWFIVCPPVLSELWTAADCPGVKGSAARYPSFSRSTAGFLVCRTAADCRGVIAIAALYSSVSRTTEERVVCRTAAVCPRIRTIERYPEVCRAAAPCSGVSRTIGCCSCVIRTCCTQL